MANGKQPSGAANRRRRREQGKPPYSPREIEARRRYNRRRHRRDRQSGTDSVAELKLKLGCTDCGYKGHAAALDFDHLPGFKKLTEVSALLKGPRSVLLAEIAKCEVVCANCHRIRTWRRNQERQPAPRAAGPAKRAEQLTLL